MKDPLSLFPRQVKYHVPLTDNGQTWNGKILILSESVYNKVIELAAHKSADGKSVTLKISTAK